MADDHLKTPMAQSLNRLGAAKAADAIQLQGKSLPCTVVEVVSSGIVKVNFEVDAAPFTLPQIVVPVSWMEYTRYPVQAGDKGVVRPADAYLGAISGLGSGTPNLSAPGNLGALVFEGIGNTGWSDAIDGRALELYGPNGVILRDGNSTTVVTIGPSGIVISPLGGPITVDTGGHPVNIAGGGTVTVSGGGDVIAGTVSLLHHEHSGVQTGGGVSGPPVP